MRREFIIDGGIATEEFPFGSMLCRFSSTNGGHVGIRVCRRCKINPCQCRMADRKLMCTVKRKPVPYCSETMLENLRKQDISRLQSGNPD
ncbi:hypothetical protein G1C97_1074 [Bifidobacterium sp. DSM 109959]|uniref:Uncharacterized protein n=1 Tax=Bifidobacterium olomucense TaxID=2675324 RepID=A0A7Y0EXA9_9BIFI|nr:hypothetical protein [Bifidobacterium sp. DSM 109959]